MKLAIIAAVARNRVIGKDGTLPWHISEDLKRFKKLTTGHAVLMGRRTFESIGKPLAHRRNVVVTSRTFEGVECYPTVEQAVEALGDEDIVFVIGGARLFARFLPDADILHLTHVERDVEGDTFFPASREDLAAAFELISTEPHDGYTFAEYRRRPPVLS